MKARILASIIIGRRRDIDLVLIRKFTLPCVTGRSREKFSDLGHSWIWAVDMNVTDGNIRSESFCPSRRVPRLGTMNKLAHLEGADGRPHCLIDHLRDVADRARGIADSVRTDRAGLVRMAEWAGWLHDLGKYRVEFQDYLSKLRGKSKETQHSVFGAAAARKSGLPMAISFAINGHHAGLHDLADLDDKTRCPELDPLGRAERLLRCLSDDPKATLPAILGEVFTPGRGDAGFSVYETHEEFLIRMLFFLPGRRRLP